MKMGVRRPSVRRSISARTTGKVKRSISRTVNPLYGKKGMGYINDPKKAVYNSIYSRTTIGVNPLSNHNSIPTESLSSLTVEDLKSILRENGLKVSGNKQELIDRITQYIATLPKEQSKPYSNDARKKVCPLCNGIFIHHTLCPDCGQELIEQNEYNALSCEDKKDKKKHYKLYILAYMALGIILCSVNSFIIASIMFLLAFITFIVAISE